MHLKVLFLNPQIFCAVIRMLKSQDEMNFSGVASQVLGGMFYSSKTLDLQYLFVIYVHPHSIFLCIPVFPLRPNTLVYS